MHYFYNFTERHNQNKADSAVNIKRHLSSLLVDNWIYE